MATQCQPGVKINHKIYHTNRKPSGLHQNYPLLKLAAFDVPKTRGTYHLATYMAGEIILNLPFDLQDLSTFLFVGFLFYVDFYGFYGIQFFSSLPGYGLFQYILTRIRMSMTHRTFSNLPTGLRISLLFLISEF